MTLRGLQFMGAAALAATLGFGAAGTASATTFTVDPGDVTVTGVDFCWPGNCTLDGAVTGASFNLGPVGDSVTIGDLFDWNVLLTNPWATGAGIYSVSVTLNFSAPSTATGNGAGWAGFKTFIGTISAGVLDWTVDTGQIAFAGGRVLDFKLHDAVRIGFGTGASTGATFTVAAVPLPAGALLLLGGLGGLGGLGALRRRRKAA